MKKTIITAVLVVAISSAFAQAKKPNVKPIAPAAVSVDTSSYRLSAIALAARVSSTNNLLYLIKQGTNDVTPNQMRAAVYLADSLQKVDQAWLNKSTAKNAIKTKP